MPSDKDIMRVINYHVNEAAYCRMVRLQSWGRSRSFNLMWQRREDYHRRIIKALRNHHDNS